MDLGYVVVTVDLMTENAVVRTLYDLTSGSGSIREGIHPTVFDTSTLLLVILVVLSA